ncbi:cytochrome P450 [Phycomyces nitens]|nr:cytochrome P450 [Phycomyces nitens]
MDAEWLKLFLMEDYPAETRGAVAAGVALVLAYSIHSFVSLKRNTDVWNRKGYMKIPTPQDRYPYFGHMLSMGKKPFLQLEKWHQELGPVVHIQMGIQPWVLISDPYIAHELFVKNEVKSSDRMRHAFTYDAYSKRGKGIVFIPPDQEWKKCRTVAESILSVESIGRFANIIEAVADNTINHLREVTEKDGSVSPVKYIQKAIFRIMISLLFGKTPGSIEDSLLDRIISMAENELRLAGPSGDIGSFLRYSSWTNILTRRSKEIKSVVDSRDSLYRELISEAVAGEANSLAKNAHLLKEKYNLDEMDLIIMMSELIGAGGDTTAASASWLFAILARYPDIQERMCKEIDEFVAKNGHLPEFSDRKEVPYIIAVLRENLRYRSVTCLGLPHLAAEDVELLGYYIPKGTILISSMPGLHMNQEVFDDPRKFNPERFLGDLSTWSESTHGDIKTRNVFAFGWGKRSCPGVNLAEMNVFNICVRTFAHYTIEPTLGIDGKPVYADLDNILSLGTLYGPNEYAIKIVERTQ